MSFADDRGMFVPTILTTGAGRGRFGLCGGIETSTNAHFDVPHVMTPGSPCIFQVLKSLKTPIRPSIWCASKVGRSFGFSLKKRNLTAVSTDRQLLSRIVKVTM